MLGIRRRDFITAMGGAAASALFPQIAAAQQLPLIGILLPNRADTAAAIVAVYVDALRRAGYIEGHNVAIEYRYADDRRDRLPALATDLVRRQVTVILAVGGPAALAAKAATSTIPIVFSFGSDPVKLGLVSSLNRPGGNATGVTNVTTTLAAKRIELLHKLVPDADKIGVLVDPGALGSDTEWTDLEAAASALRLRLIFLRAGNEQEIDTAFAGLAQQHVRALLLTDSTLFNSRREQLVALARFNAIPSLYTFREFAVAGGLMSYASSITDARRQAGNYVARILNGEKPADLPVMQPTKFELVINLKTAKALNLKVPAQLLAIADEVIE